MRNKTSQAQTLINAVAEGASLGYSGKGQAALAAGLLYANNPKTPYNDYYKQALQAVEEINKTAAKEHPWTYYGGNIAGGATLPWKNPFTGIAPKTVKGAATLGAGYGAASGVGHNIEGATIPEMLTGQNYDVSEDILSGLGGAGVGAAFGGGLQYLQNLPLIQQAGQVIGSKLKSITEPIKQAYQSINPSGRNISNATPERINALTTSEVPRGLELSEKFDVPLTRGELTQLPEHLIDEEMALRGWQGTPIMESGKQLQKNQRQTFEEALTDKVQNAIAEVKNVLGEKEGFIEKGTHARNAINELTSKAAAEKKIHGQAYQEAGRNEAIIDINHVREFPKYAENILQSKLAVTEKTAPQAYAQLEAFNTLFNKPVKEGEDVIGASVKSMEAWHQGLNQARSHNNRNADNKALNELSYIFNDYVDDIVENSLISGDANAWAKFREARGLAAQYFKKYGPGNNKDKAQNFINEIVTNAENGLELTNEQLVDRVFGSSEMGFDKASGAIMKRMQQMLSPEGYNQFKLEALQKILTPLRMERPQAGVYKKNLNRLLRQQPTLMKTLFKPQDISLMKDVGDLGMRIYTRPINRMNPSGTGEFIGKMRKLISSIPAAGQTVDLVAELAKIANRSKVSFNPETIKTRTLNPEKPLTKFKSGIAIGIPNTKSESEQ